MKIQKSIYIVFLLLLTVVLISAKSQLKQKNITVKKMVQLIDTCHNLKIIDIRSSELYKLAHLKDALNAEKSEQLFRIIDSLGTENTYVVYCKKGKMSEQAIRILLSKYDMKVYSLKGGFERWLQKGMATYSN